MPCSVYAKLPISIIRKFHIFKWHFDPEGGKFFSNFYFITRKAVISAFQRALNCYIPHTTSQDTAFQKYPYFGPIFPKMVKKKETAVTTKVQEIKPSPLSTTMGQLHTWSGQIFIPDTLKPKKHIFFRTTPTPTIYPVLYCSCRHGTLQSTITATWDEFTIYKL